MHYLAVKTGSLMKGVLVLLLFFCFGAVSAQVPVAVHAEKGNLFIYWGWNRGYYQDSDIHFRGADHDFTLHQVAARDRQTPFKLDPYFKLNSISIPQTNLRIGYMLSEHYSISIGDDHMKYVMRQYQEVSITGYIDGHPEYAGEYIGESIELSPRFLTFEHTDGLNYINLELRRHDTWFRGKRDNLSVSSVIGWGAGAVVPRTNATLLDRPRSDVYHLSGWGSAFLGGVRLTIFKRFFLQSEAKGGFIHMPDIIVSPLANDRASQHFFFFQHNYVFGVSVPLSKKPKPVKTD